MRHSTRGTARKRIDEELHTRPNFQNDTAAGAAMPDAAAVAEIARYIAQLSAEMSQMAAKVKLETLAYFLSMARLEAEMQARRPPGP